MNLNIKKLSDHTGAEINNINLNKIYDEDTNGTGHSCTPTLSLIHI